MKNIALYTLLLLSVELCQAQVSGNPLIDHSSIWYTQSSSAYFDFGNCNQNFALARSNLTYWIEGDTVINDNTYLRMYFERSDTTYCSNDPSIYWTNYASGFRTFIREDQNRLIAYDENGETVIHDYESIEIGDSLSFDCVIGSIDTLFLLQQPYLRYNCECNSEFLVQGIGTKRSLFANLNCGQGIEGDTRNLCYSKNGFTIKIDSTSNCISTADTSLFVATNEGLSVSEYRMYPNPTSGEFIVKIDGNTGLKNYSVYTLGGEEMQRSRLIHSQEVLINLSDVANGMYFIVVELEGGKIIRDKIVILKE